MDCLHPPTSPKLPVHLSLPPPRAQHARDPGDRVEPGRGVDALTLVKGCWVGNDFLPLPPALTKEALRVMAASDCRPSPLGEVCHAPPSWSRQPPLPSRSWLGTPVLLWEGLQLCPGSGIRWGSKAQGWCCGWDSVSHKVVFKSCALEPRDAALLRQRVIADLSVKRGSHWSRVGLSSSTTGGLVREKMRTPWRPSN